VSFTDYAMNTALCPGTVNGMTNYSKTDQMNVKTMISMRHNAGSIQIITSEFE